MWHTYYAPRSVPEALDLLAQHGAACRVIAGGTDLILELERGARKPQILVDVSRVWGLDQVELSNGTLRIGAAATHNQVVASAPAVAHAFPLARACWQVGAPQIRNRGTIAGNLVTASPANDTITPLWAMDAAVVLASRERGERTLSFGRFFLGVRRTALEPDEMLVRVEAPALGPNERGTFLKLGLRQAQAISVVNVAVVLSFEAVIGEGSAVPGPEARIHDSANRVYFPVARARIALGSVAPTIVRASEAEAYLTGKSLTEENIARAAELTASAARPISDIRASAEYRRDMARVMAARALRQLRDGAERTGWPEQPVLLWGSGRHEREDRWSGPAARSCASQEGSLARGLGTCPPPAAAHPPAPLPDEIHLILNGRPATLRGARGKTLLRALREDAGLTGSKEGCAEGECGACTVWLDGVAVMSCLVPAERAEGCEVTTVEGLAPLGPAWRTRLRGGVPACGEALDRREGVAQLGADAHGAVAGGERLHPLQQAFIDAAAVQCGYCTPGLLMSAANLLLEVDQPDSVQIREALTGNLCRCTGYYSILRAVEKAVG